MDQRQHVACCQFADDEALEHESENFDCESCPVTAHLAGMDVDNRRAWDLSHLVLTRFAHDSHGVAAFVVRLTPDLDEDDFADLLRRMTLIYDVLAPPRAIQSS